ncbi:RPM1-interacting protein 4-like [Andrographis paniculata]|uniref:RPM1-interacting protein 4-like n=1 Tax=Andrographis paniculata TaxID=175694 RepID=UPI0021E709CC|nr:RPM1-interacting protein 4-like [Andrographis paniculata]
MARSNVPKFGNWENEDNVPYTVYFEKARKNRGGGKMTNPNDPQENQEVFDVPPRSKPNEPVGRGAAERVAEQRGGSKGDGDLIHPNKSPARVENTVQKTGNELNYGAPRGQRPARPARTSGGSDSMERSPLHPRYPAKVMGVGSASPTPTSWDGRNYESVRGDQGRSRPKPVARGDESPDASAAVPKFGEWDENDPSSAEQFTGIFDKVREERHSSHNNVSGGTPRHSSHNRGQQAAKQPKCCFL